MIVARDRDELREGVSALRKRGLSIGFVPTMGALHEGHLSLVRRAKTDGAVVVSIFVNPTQFGPNEDFDRYPRTTETDLALLRSVGVDVVYLPSVEALYPEGFSTTVEETRLSQVLCGKFRPGHFRGVTTIVAKLLHLVSPNRMYLGQKDAQQLRILEKMAEDLDFEVEILGCPTIREPDGLAMSSRNAYLSTDHRAKATTVYAALVRAKAAFLEGERSSEKLKRWAEEELLRVPDLKIQYVELVRWSDLAVEDRVKELSILAVALYIGSTRLIDNVFLDPTKD